MNNIRFLVTGVAADIGLGIGRILRDEYPDAFLLGVDVDEDNPSMFYFDEFMAAPYAGDFDYVDFIKETVQKFSIQIIIPTSEAEIDIFWRLGLVQILEDMNVHVLILNQNIVDVALDKYQTFLFLKESGFNYPWTFLADDYSNIKSETFPMISKPRSGQGSKNIHILYSIGDLEKTDNTKSYIVQELLSDPKSEYTCCVFGSNGSYRSIAFNRTLKGGFTYSGKVVENKAIDNYIESIARALNLEGSVNLQLRLTERGPVLFEINPRFSSALVFRHKLGFKDLIWTVENITSGLVSEYQKPKVGIRFCRGITEYIF